jgi:hypothetical protein
MESRKKAKSENRVTQWIGSVAYSQDIGWMRGLEHDFKVEIGRKSRGICGFYVMGAGTVCCA